MNVYFVRRTAADLVFVDAQHQVTVSRLRIVTLELFARQVPMRIQPVRIAGRQKQSARAVSLRQILSGRGGLGGRWARMRVAFARTAGAGLRRWRIAFK